MFQAYAGSVQFLEAKRIWSDTCLNGIPRALRMTSRDAADTLRGVNAILRRVTVVFRGVSASSIGLTLTLRHVLATLRCVGASLGRDEFKFSLRISILLF